MDDLHYWQVVLGLGHCHSSKEESVDQQQGADYHCPNLVVKVVDVHCCLKEEKG